MEDLKHFRKTLSATVEGRGTQRPRGIRATVLKQETDYSDVETETSSSCDSDEYESEVELESDEGRGIYTSRSGSEAVYCSSEDEEVHDQSSEEELEDEGQGDENSGNELLTKVFNEMSTSYRIEKIRHYLNEHASPEEDETAEENTCAEADFVNVDLDSDSIPVENERSENTKSLPDFGRDFVIIIGALRQSLIHITWELELFKDVRISFFAGPEQQGFPLTLTQEEYENKLAQDSITKAFDSHMELVRHKSDFMEMLQMIRPSLLRFDEFAGILIKLVPKNEEVAFEVIAKDGSNTMITCICLDPASPNDNELMKLCLRLDCALIFLSEKLMNARLLLKEKILFTATKEAAMILNEEEEKDEVENVRNFKNCCKCM